MTDIKNDVEKIGIIILAAGASSRLGSAKQLLVYNGHTLLQHALHAALDSVAHPVIIVLGAGEHDIRKKVNLNKVNTVVNTDWQEGMASSIRCGIHTLLLIEPQSEGAVIMLCDQPHVSSSLLNELVQTHQNTAKPIIASSYNNTAGVPAYFHKKIFPALLGLKGDTGARSIIQQHAGETATVVFSKGSIDIDTAADYKELSKDNDKA